MVKETMPVPCVDLVVLDPIGRALLVKRVNHPAIGQWWFPGGRVHFLESREAAAARKLAEECNLVAVALTDLGSFDLIISGAELALPSHAITTLFLVRVVDTTNLRLDQQGSAAEWRAPQAWLGETLHPFVAGALRSIPPDAP